MYESAQLRTSHKPISDDHPTSCLTSSLSTPWTQSCIGVSELIWPAYTVSNFFKTKEKFLIFHNYKKKDETIKTD